jgi:hypothetical protein
LFPAHDQRPLVYLFDWPRGGVDELGNSSGDGWIVVFLLADDKRLREAVVRQGRVGGAEIGECVRRDKARMDVKPARQRLPAGAERVDQAFHAGPEGRGYGDIVRAEGIDVSHVETRVVACDLLGEVVAWCSLTDNVVASLRDAARLDESAHVPDQLLALIEGRRVIVVPRPHLGRVALVARVEEDGQALKPGAADIGEEPQRFVRNGSSSRPVRDAGNHGSAARISGP